MPMTGLNACFLGLQSRPRTMMRGWCCRRERGTRGDASEPIAQLWVPRPPVQIGVAGLEHESAGERDLRQIEFASHHRMLDLRLPEVGHASATVRFVPDDRRRALMLRSRDFAPPNRDPVQHTCRQGAETARLPYKVSPRQIKGWMAIKVIEIGTDDGGFLQSDAVVTDQIGDSARWIDAVVRAMREARLSGDDLHPALQPLLQDHNPRDTRIGRARGDVEFHGV